MRRLPGVISLILVLAACAWAEPWDSGGIAPNSVTLGTDTTGSYAAGTAEAGAATSGDSATAFFAAGQLEQARGGTNQDSSAQTGVPFINAGTWSFGNIGQSYVTDLPTDLANLAAAIGQGGGSSSNVGSSLSSGCGFEHTTGLTFSVSACTYYINGVQYSSPANTVTLTTADVSNPRIDTLIVTTSSVANKATGTAAANPTQPSLDPSSELAIASVHLAAGATTPTGLVNESVYAEDAEWPCTPGTGSACADTASPHAGTKDIKFTAVAANAFLKLVRSTTLSLTTYQQLNLWIAPATGSSWANGRSIVLTLRDANGVQVGQPITITNGSYGFVRTTAAYQLIAIPLSQFAVPASTVIKELRITPQGTGGTFTFYVDDIGFQTASQSFTLQQLDARYPLRSNNLSDIADASTARANLGVAGASSAVTWIAAAGCQNTTAGSIWDLPTSSPAVAACVTGTNTQKGVLDFADSASLSAQLTLKLPTTYAGTSVATSVKIKWLTTATSGAVVWQVSTICVADAETDDPAFNTASTVTDTAKGTTNQTNDAAIASLTMTGCAADELLHVKILRDSAHGSDTLAATARLIGVEMLVPRT